MDRERLLAFFRTHYLSRREVLNKLPLSMDAESFWKDLQSRRRSDAVTLPLYNPEERAYWYCLTDRMIAASERLSEEAISRTANLDPYRMQMTGAMTEEMYFTSFVEGAQIPIQEAMDFLQRGTEPENIQEQLIWNNCQAWSMLVSSLYRPLDEEFVKTLAYILTQEMDSQADDYRAEDGHEIAAMQGEEYRLPRAYMIPPRMGEFYAFLRQADIHPLIKASAGQAFVLAARPFPEGNERLARMISSAVLLRSGYDFFADISVSGMIARESYRYYKAMKEILSPGNGGDMTYFMEYYLEMLVRAVDERRERERIRQQRREEQERLSLEQEREMALRPLAPDPSDDGEETHHELPRGSGRETGGGQTADDGAEAREEAGEQDGPEGDVNGAADASGDERYAMIAEKVRDRIQLMSLSKTNDADIAAEFVVAMLKGGMRLFTWEDIKRTTLTPPKVISRVLKKLVRAGFIENLGPNNPKARYRMTLPEELAGDPEEYPCADARRESRVTDREAFDAKYAPMAAELREMAETATNVSRKRIASFLAMKLAKGETEFLRTEWAQEMDIEVSTAEDDVTKTVEYGLTAARHPGPNDLTVYTILPERLRSPVDTDFTVFLKKLMMFLYSNFGNRVVHTEEIRALYSEREWKNTRINIEKLVRRGMIERKSNSRFDSEYRMLVDPEERPDLFFSDDGEAERAARQYTGSASYAGPSVSYAAAGV